MTTNQGKKQSPPLLPISVCTKVGMNGFTLFELLVVLFIIGILATLVGPRMTGSLPSLRVKTAAKQTAAILRHARSRAVTENQIFQSNFDLAINSLSVIPKLEDSIEIPEETTNNAKTFMFELPETVFFKFDEAEEQFSIDFFPGGGSSGGTFAIANEKGKTWGITVDRITGTVSLFED